MLATLLVALSVKADPVGLSDSEIEGRQLAERILAQRPDNNFTNSGVLEIRDAQGKRSKAPVRFETIVTSSNWLSIYSAQLSGETGGNSGASFNELTVIHNGEKSNSYEVSNSNPPATGNTNLSVSLGTGQIMVPFAHSDYWLCDLGLEFFHWPQQKVLKKEFHRNCACIVLESTNPNPTTNSYSRVVSWIDEDSFGIVEAYAYDSMGRKLKNFYPKSLEKVNGQYQVTSMVMENLVTGSRSVFNFDVDK